MKKIFFTLICALCCASLFGQYANSLYFDKLNYRQHHLNPAFRPASKIYVGVPMLSSITVGGGNSDLSLMDIFTKGTVNGESQTLLFLDKNAKGGVDHFLEAWHGKERIHASYQIDFIDAGVRINDQLYVTLNAANKLSSSATIPEALCTFLIKGMENGEQFNFNLDKLAFSAQLYTEIGGGINMKINDRLDFGVKAKYLMGHANIQSNLTQMNMVASEEEWHITGEGSIRICTPNVEITTSDSGRIDGVLFNDERVTKPMGHGLSLDAGLAFHLTDHITLSASVLDFGFITWSGNIQEIVAKNDFVYRGLEYEVSHNNSATGWWGPYKEALRDLLGKNDHPASYTTWLNAKLLVGGEVTLLDDHLSVGILSQTHLQKHLVREEVVLAGNVRVNPYFSGTLTYSFFNGWNNIGLALNGNAGPINLYAAIDHIPLRFANIEGHKVPCYIRDMRVSAGLGVVIGYKRERN